jgi:hypothetical protein
MDTKTPDEQQVNKDQPMDTKIPDLMNNNFDYEDQSHRFINK